MCESQRVVVPVGREAARWVTRSGCRTVLGVAHTMVSAQRLLEVLELVETDPRVQVAFTVAPDVFNTGVAAWLESIGVLVLPWAQALEDTVDLVVTAGYGGIGHLTAPIVVLPHGAGYGKYVPAALPGCRASSGERGVYGLDSTRLVRDGRVVATVVVLSHDHQRQVLAVQCPAALPAAVVVGDTCLDQLAVSKAHRRVYRDAIGVGDRRLVVVASTWGPHSLFARRPDLFARLIDELDPATHAVAALLHPAVWTGHGRRQVHAWLTAARRTGLLLTDPREDWKPVLVAADCVIGDHGSVTTYAGALGYPVLHTDFPISEVHDHSPQALIGHVTARLTEGRRIGEQIQAAIAADTSAHAARIAASLTSFPGHAHHRLRTVLYHQLRLSPPAEPWIVTPVPAPASSLHWGWAS